MKLKVEELQLIGGGSNSAGESAAAGCDGCVFGLSRLLSGSY